MENTRQRLTILELLHHVFDEAIEFIKTMTWKKALISLLAMVLLGTSVTLLYSTKMGMSAWDAVTVNVKENSGLYFMWVNPMIAVILMILAHLIAWKKPSIMILFPLVISWFIGAVIDLEVLFVPDVSAYHWIINVAYMVMASILVGIGLNLIIYVDFPLPAIDRFCHAMSKRLHLTFGQGKYLGEFFAGIMAVTLGLIYGTGGVNFYLGISTIYYILFLGLIVDLIRNPLYRLLGISTMELYADDILPVDASDNELVYGLAVVIYKQKLLLMHHEDGDYYSLPVAKKHKHLRLEDSLRFGVKKTGNLNISVKEEHLIVKEYETDKTVINHYFMARFKPKTFSNKLKKWFRIIFHNKQTETEEKTFVCTPRWFEVTEALDLLSQHDAKSQEGMQMMNREFIALTSIL